MSDPINQLKSAHPYFKTREIEGILYLLKNEQGLTNNKLVQLTGVPKETLRIFKKSISSLLQETSTDDIVLSKEGIALLAALDLRPYSWSLLTYSNQDVLKTLQEIRKKMNLEPKRDFDQFFATEQSTVNKVMALKEKDLITGKNICLLGDDDLVSIALGLIDPSYTKVTVFDVDTDLLAKIRALAEEYSLKNIETQLYDVRNDVKKEFFGKYDVVVTDPPYTPNGITLFLSRSLSFIGNAVDMSGKYIYLFYGNSFKSQEKTLKIQEILSTFNLLIEDKIDKFVRYNGAESIGSASSLYILKVTPFSKPLSYELLPQIYTFENVAEEKFPFVDHVTFKLQKVPAEIVSSQKEIGKAVEQFCRIHKLNIVDTKVTKFKKQGYTFTFVLASSNLLIHTWPEYKALHIDLITCVPIYLKEALGATLSKVFKTKYIEERIIE